MNQPCNNLFIFCAGPRGQASVDTGTCPYGIFNFTRFDDDFSFTNTSSSIVSGSQVPNPIVFQGDERWTVSVWLLLKFSTMKLLFHFLGTISTKYCS